MAEKKISGRQFIVEPMPVAAAIALYSELTAALGSALPRLPAIILAATQEGEEQDLMAGVASLAALSDIIGTLGAQGSADLVKRICEVAQIRRPSGEVHPVDFDGDFTGHLNDIVPVAKFVLQEQFSDFFLASGGNGLLAQLKAAFLNAKSSGSPPT